MSRMLCHMMLGNTKIPNSGKSTWYKHETSQKQQRHCDLDAKPVHTDSNVYIFIFHTVLNTRNCIVLQQRGKNIFLCLYIK